MSGAQRQRWTTTFVAKSQMYGDHPSAPGRYAANLFLEAGARDVLELGAGQGRDTIGLLDAGLSVTALDFSAEALDQLKHDAGPRHPRLRTLVHDVRTPLALDGLSFDAVFAHMLFCMALSTAQLEQLMAEVQRLLRRGGKIVYTVRHVGDADYGRGIAHGENIYENNGFAVHFFDRALVDRLSDGFELLAITEFEEGGLPRRLWQITQRKPASIPA